MDSLVCPLCNVFTAFTPVRVRLPEYLSSDPAFIPAIAPEESLGLPFARDEGKEVEVYAIAQCQGCGGIFVAHRNRENWEPVYPITHKILPVDVPEPIKGEVEEASLCLTVGAYRACLTISSVALEHLWNNQKVSGLEELKRQEIISPRLCRRANEIRLWGNLVKHVPMIDPVTKEDAEQLLGYLELILDEVYVEPNRLINLTDRRKGFDNRK
jgi:hypothetical protein